MWQVAPEGRARALFVGERRVLAWINGKEGAWIVDPWTGEVQGGRLDVQVERAARDPRGDVVVACADRRLLRLAPEGAALVAALPPRGNAVLGLTVGAARLAVLHGEIVHVLDRADGQVVRKIVPIADAPGELALIGDDRVVVVGSGPEVTRRDLMAAVRAFEVATGELVFEQHAGARATWLAAVPGRGLLAGTSTGMLGLFDARGERIVQFVSVRGPPRLRGRAPGRPGPRGLRARRAAPRRRPAPGDRGRRPRRGGARRPALLGRRDRRGGGRAGALARRLHGGGRRARRARRRGGPRLGGDRGVGRAAPRGRPGPRAARAPASGGGGAAEGR